LTNFPVTPGNFSCSLSHNLRDTYKLHATLTPKKIRCSVARIVAKSRTDFYFSQRLRHQKSCERCSFQGVLHWAIFRATCIATKLRDKLQKKGNRSMITVTNIATLHLSFMECKYVSSTYSTCSTKSTCSSSSTCSTWSTCNTSSTCSTCSTCSTNSTCSICSTCSSLRSRRKRGGRRGARTREKGDWGLGTRERLLQRPPFFHFYGRQRPQNSDWLIFDSTSHGNDVI